MKNNMKLKTNPTITIEILLSKTKLGHIKWKHVDENDLYYEPDKEKYTSKYKATENKIIDILLTKRKLPFSGENYYISFHYKTKQIILWRTDGSDKNSGISKKAS